MISYKVGILCIVLIKILLKLKEKGMEDNE